MPTTDAAPSPWIRRFAPLVAPGGRVLDLACGRGRHARLFHDLGHPVTAIDRDGDALAALAGLDGVETIAADLERGPGGEPCAWPPGERRFAGIVVANYLHRPLFPSILAALEPGGVLIYETFAEGNAAFGRPANPDFLLRRGELLERVRGRLRVVAYEDGYIARPRPAMVQRICAAAEPGDRPPRAWPLAPETV